MSKAKHTYKVGQKVTFTGYTQLDAGQPEILTVGAEYEIIKDKGEEGFEVANRDGSQADTVFDDEIAPVEQKSKRGRKPKAEQTDAPVAAKKAKAPAKAAPVKAPAKAKPKKGGKKTKATNEHKVAPEQALSEIGAMVQPIEDNATVKAILESKDMLVAAKELAVAAEETFISLGGVLHHIYETGAHKHLGYDGKRGFADYMLNELNILYRKGMYLIEIYNVARRYNLDERLLAEIGWSKMKEIANKVTADNANELLEFARDHSREELVDHVRKTYVKAGTEREERVLKTRLTFSLFGDQAQVVERALAAASQQIDNATPERALEMICAEWSQFTENVELSAEEASRALIERFGVEAIQSVVTAAIENAETKELVSA